MSASPFDLLKPFAGRALELALNRALALDPDTRAALAPLEGRSIVLSLESPPLSMQIRVGGNALQIGPASEIEEPDLSVRSTLGGMLSQLPFLRRDAGSTPVGKVRISGDADLARRLQQLADRFDPDWQQPFVSVFGEVIGVQIAQAFSAAFRQTRAGAQRFADDTAEFLTEESRDVVGRGELNAFHDDVDALRDDVERLAARINRLASQRGTA